MTDQHDMNRVFGDLFGHAFKKPEPEQAEQLERVSVRIGAAIVAFCKSRVGKEFHADDLRAHVEASCGKTAPGSSDRILRDLRQRQVVAYRVVSRKHSRYLVEAA